MSTIPLGDEPEVASNLLVLVPRLALPTVSPARMLTVLEEEPTQ